MIWLLHIFVVNILLLVSKYLKNKNIFITGSFIYVIFIYGQRWLSGTDFPGYLRYYITGYTKWNEFIYFSIQELFAFFGIYFGLFLMVVLLITTINFYRFLVKIDNRVEVMIYLFLFSEIFFAQLSQIRQYAAVSFFVMAYYYSFQKEYFKTILNVILAVGFHFSALAVSFLMFFRLKINRMRGLVILAFTAFLPLINIQFIFSLGIFSRYAGYVDSRFNVPLSSFHLVKFYSLLIIVAVYFILIDRFKDSKIEQFILNGILMNLILYGVSFQFAILLRVSAYFKIFEIAFLVYFFDRLKDTSKTVILTGVMTYLLGVFGGVVLTDPYNLNKYEFEPMRIIDMRGEEFLRGEIDRFYENE